MKKLTLGLASVGLVASLGAYAALPTGAAPFQINIPNLKSGITFNLTGLYLRGSSSDLDYGVASPATPSTTSAATVYSVKPKYKFGYHLGLGYVFPNSGNDVQLAYTYFNSTQNNSSSVKAGQSFGPIDYPLVAGVGGGDANGSVQFKYNAVDLNVGQYISLGTRLQTRLFGGFRYADLTDNFNGLYLTHSTNANDVSSLSAGYQSQLRGFGPRFGLDTSYYITDSFGIVGSVSSALLVSRIKTDTLANIQYVQPTEGAGKAPVSLSVNTDRVNRVVPNVEGKLGLDYSFPFSSSALSVAAGYQMSHYFGAVDRVLITGVRKTSDFSLDGPFLSLNLKAG